MKTWMVLVLLVLASALVACDDDKEAIAEITPISNAAAATIANQPTTTPLPITPLDDSALGDATPTPRPPTPTPLDNQVESGSARAIAATYDAAFHPTPRNPIEITEAEPIGLTFSQFYDAYDMRRGLVVSDFLVALDGREVVMEGYVAPPLKPKLDFFVLTEMRLSICPFCSTDADWPDRIALVYMPEEGIIDFAYPVRVTGRIEVGSQMDIESGMVSMVRLYADEIEEIR